MDIFGDGYCIDYCADVSDYLVKRAVHGAVLTHNLGTITFDLVFLENYNYKLQINTTIIYSIYIYMDFRKPQW